MSSDTGSSRWSDEERTTLINFLLKEKRAGRLKAMFKDINDWRGSSGKHWDNANGANILSEYDKQAFKDFMEKNLKSNMSCFKTSGWTHFDTMDALLPGDFARGSHAYHPAATGTTAPSASTNISSAPAASNISVSSSVSRLSPSIPLSGTGSVPGISAGPGIPNFPPLNYTGPYFGSSSSHMSSNPIMMPPVQLCYPTPFIGSATGTVAQGGISEKAFPHSIDLQPQVFSAQFGSPHSSVPPPLLYHQSSHNSGALSMAGSTQSKKRSLAEVGTSKAGGQGLSVQAALENLTLNQEERPSKRTKKESVTPALLSGIQGTLQYVGSAITLSSVVAAEQRRSDQIYTALNAMEERDPDLPDEIKVGMMEAFRKDPSTINIYLMTPNKALCWHWVNACLSDFGLVQRDYELAAPCSI
ncbi:hypothetical protein SCLCIDRAFT_29374 [Scleroderma citrinum Foug A]|uniref:Myb/SANT-like domain-containing protein n=1 Tax=Scleroderma citrinum Foug A TaxID=1036808 RepID=A0A0C2Z457_9AGAM|nr:hypothetical protein SCLCIDRAFT_29374 [Scleroderma citrinum Foug A]